MKKSVKVGLLSSVLLTPAAIALVEQPVAASNTTELTEAEKQEQIDRAITYFTNLNMSSSMADVSIYMEILDKAFPEDAKKEPDEQGAIYALMKGKLEYIQSYNAQKITADGLKTEISKLTLTNKTLVQSYNEANAKYEGLLSKLEELNTSLDAKKKAVSDEAYKDLLNKLTTLYDPQTGKTRLATELVTELISSANQNLLATRGEQVKNFNASGYAKAVLKIYGAQNADTYLDDIKNAKLDYAKLTTEEKTIADNQLVEGSTTVTLKQAMAAAEDNVAKAAAFDQNVTAINPDVSTEKNITSLKTQLIAIDRVYNALTPIQKLLISQASLEIVKPFQGILTISGQIGDLKANNTQQYREAVNKIQKDIDALGTIIIGQVVIAKDNVVKIIPNFEKLTEAQKDIEAVVKVETKITALKGSVEAPTPDLNKVQDARKDYNALSSNQKKLVMNLADLTVWESADKDAAAVEKKINAIKVSNKADFYKRYIEGQNAYDKLNTSIKEYVKNRERLHSLEPYAKLVNDFILLDVKATDYTTKVGTLLATLTSPDSVWINTKIDGLQGLTDEDKQQLKVVRDTLSDRRSSTDKAETLIINIDNLAKVAPKELLQKIVLYRSTYNDLDSTAKKLVTNIKTLTEYEKANKAAVNVIKQINSLDPLNTKFVNSALSARKAYDKLNTALKALVDEGKLAEKEKISSVMFEIENLKKSRNILADAKKARESFNALIAQLTDQPELIALLNEKYAPKIDAAEKRDENVAEVIKQINQLEINNTNSIGDVIKNIATMYKSLTSSDKKSVTNYSTFKVIEKDYKAALKVYNLIEELPTKEADNYTKKVEAALKAYRKLTPAQTKYVFNYESKLLPVVGVASLIGDIDSIKASMKDLATFISELRTRYNALSTAEKDQVYNYKKLEAAEQALNGANSVIQLIQSARPGVGNYLDALQKARDAYDMLGSDQKKQVTNYKELQNREKQLKPILDLNDLIIKIGFQSSAKNFISNYDKAWKELEKVSLQDRALLTSEKLLTETYVPLYNVMNRIESIKSSSKTFVDDVKAARTAYEALSADQKAKILNVDLLREHEVNVQGGAYVDALIRALKSNPPAVYVQKVQEAEEAYKNLSSANKKAVTLYDELKVELKYIAPVVQAIQAIDLLETSGGKLDAQVKKVNSIFAKLTDEQYALIPNMAKYNNLGNVIQVVSLIELIKPSDTKYYIGNTKAAEIAYNRLSPEEKQKVTNYSNLEEALLNVAALDQITKKISELSNLSTTYVNDVKSLLDEYKKLPSALKKQVSNYGNLERAEKDIDSADKVIRAIAAIDPSVRTFESKVVSARKQYDKLTDDQKTLVSNARLLLQYERELGL